MDTEEIVYKILSHHWPLDEELVSLALERRGFGGDDGYYGLAYPHDLDEYDQALGAGIPEGMLELTYFDDGIKEALIPERDYLELLEAFLRERNKSGLAKKMDGFK